MKMTKIKVRDESKNWKVKLYWQKAERRGVFGIAEWELINE